MSTDIEELEGSELGTKEYWDQQYKNEIENFRAHGDIGDVWFGEDSVERVIKWMLKHNDIIKKDSTILDIGCGNGMILINLAEEQFSQLIGVDYSESAVQLAEEIANKQNLSITYEVSDILDEEIKFENQFDLAHDKGTYDAISLDPVNPKEKRNKYINNVAKILKNNGLIIVTSCNWTQDELVLQFKEQFKLFDVIPTPQFKFGNKVGNVVTSVVFQRIL